MANFSVTQNTDNGQGDVKGSLSWAIKRANQKAGDDSITLTTDVTLSGEMNQLIDSNITIDGGDGSNDSDSKYYINGGRTHRPLFIRSGTVEINNVGIAEGLAEGERGGGGGAGLGGGIFIYSGNVTLSNVNLYGNQARGGYGYEYSNVGGGFKPLFSGGQGNRTGGFGSGGGRSDTGSGGTAGIDGGFGGFGGGGGGGGVGDYLFFAEGLGYGFYGPSGAPGKGGFGGADGGLATDSGGRGEYARDGYGGGGAGLGGGIFIRTGSLNLIDTEFFYNSAVGGFGYNYGQGLGGAVFALHTTQNTNGNNLGMPDTLPIVNISTSTTFFSNRASSATEINEFGFGDNLNNPAVFGPTNFLEDNPPAGLNSIQGSSRKDVLSGTRNADEILGLNGNDTLSGRQGADTINGGNGNDKLMGDQGNDRLIGSVGNDRLEGGSGEDILDGGQGNDRLDGGQGNDRLIAGGGNDILTGGSGNDLLDGERGNDKLDGGNGNDVLIGFAGNDSLKGDGGNDRLEGGQGRDRLFGGSGSDDLLGGTGNDILKGDGGNDRLKGGEGRDILTGGGGQDTFVIASGGRLPVRDVISDFRAGQDKIEVTGLSFGALSFKSNKISITETGEIIAQLTGIETTTLTAADFVA
ncbi:MAG: calcium-binding protein [Cyanobacteria bacterium J06560_2]